MFRSISMRSLGTLLVAASAVSASTAHAQDKRFSPELTAMIEAAKTEPPLKASYGTTLMAGEVGLRDFIAGMNKKYGLRTKFVFTPGGSAPANLQKLAQEVRAGRPATTDIYFGTSQDILTASKMKPAPLKSFNWAKLVDRKIPVHQELNFNPVSAGSKAVAVTVYIPGISYNEKLVPSNLVPRTLNDLLNPELKGKIASTPYALGIREYSAEDFLGSAALLKFLGKFTGQLGGLMRCTDVVDRLSSGEFWIMAPDCGGQDAWVARKKGAPVKHVLLQDLVNVDLIYASVPVNSAAPNTAALVSAFLLEALGF